MNEEYEKLKILYENNEIKHKKEVEMLKEERDLYKKELEILKKVKYYKKQKIKIYKDKNEEAIVKFQQIWKRKRIRKKFYSFGKGFFI
jgi:hypothetical protein